MLSPEDVDWADSCLSKEDPGMSDSGWNLNSLSDALLETRSTQNISSPYERDDSTERPKMENFSKVDTVGGRNLVKTAINNSTATTSVGTQEPKGDDLLNHENTGDFWLSHKMEDIFLPTYNESLRDHLGVSDPDVDFVFQEFELEQSTQDIFKIWDLDIAHEEDDDDDLVKQLDKALVENSIDPISSVSDDDDDDDDDDSIAWKGLQDDEELDDLISGIADLALSPNSV